MLALARTRVLGIDLPRGRDLGPILVAWAASLAVLVFERDLGTSLLFFGLFVAMLYIATERRSWLFIGAALFSLGAFAAYQLFAHVQLRVGIWLDPFADEANTGYQIAQSLYGFATGGMLGVGLGQGHPDFVPFAKTDFIMAAFGEELGLTGVMALLVLYAIIVERGLRTASQCATASASCSQRVCRSPSESRCSSSLAASPSSSHSPASPLRSFATAVRRWWPTGPWSRCCCGSATARGVRQAATPDARPRQAEVSK